jgi:hypothetical protein
MVCEYATPTVPFGSEAVVIDKAPTTTSVNALVLVTLRLSVTWTVKVEVPAAAGVPAMAPDEGFSESGAGKAPPPGTIDQVYGGVPPTAWSVCEYATPTVALGRDGAVVMVSPLAIVMVNGLVTGVVDALSLS